MFIKERRLFIYRGPHRTINNHYQFKNYKIKVRIAFVGIVKEMFKQK